MIATANLALRFVLELAGLAALAYAAFQSVDGPARWLAAIGAPILLGLLWAFVVAPGAANPIAAPLREIIGSIALLGAAGALALAGHTRPAVAFAVLIVANQVLLTVLRDHPAGAVFAR